MSKTFDLGDILSLTTGRLVSLRHVSGIYDILNYMTHDDLFTHQLPRAGRECKPWLLRQHPQLASVDASGINEDNWRSWLSDQKALFGDELSVDRIPQDDHDRVDPVAELESMVGKDKVIVVDI